ncbi:hypothetical protein ACF3M1_03610 [Luteimonas sp. WGS1318]|uniref:hypothetical protein n=1 Tax=Luteimonas sp. WGS1318 TaxID=3366815 RepID=UPI00372D1892
MRAPRLGLVAVLALVIALPALAQDRSLQARMGVEEFRAAGLQKLDAEELARLDAWFARQLERETTAAVAAVDRPEPSTRAPRAAEAPVDSTLVGTFTGFAKGREYTLANGQVWRQTDAAVLPGVTLETASVQIRPARLGGWWLKINDYNTRARVERVR